MLKRRIARPILLAALALSCRGPASPRSSDPVALASPDAPTRLQERLAAMQPAAPLVQSDAAVRLDRAVDAFHDRTKGRRGYIAIDKPLYQPGETIWFRMFDLTSATLAGTERDAANVKLINPRGAVAMERRILVENGAAANDFVLGADLPGGEYILRAESDGGNKAERKIIVSSYEAPRIKKKLEFTRKAYGPGDSVMATVALHRATGEAMASKAITALVTLDGGDLARVPVTTDSEGNATAKFELPAQIRRGDGLLTILVEDGGVTESVQKRIPITLKDIALTFYPEGGDLIAGLPARVYFGARNSLDKPADIEGRVLDETGREVALLRSYHDGLGRFDLVPGAGSYRVEITKPAGIAKTYTLPVAKAEGCAMQALDDFASVRADLRVAVWCTHAQSVVVTGVLREKRVATATASVASDQPTVVSLPMPAGAQGAVRVTVFDDHLAPQAERLAYRNRGSDLKVTITPDRVTYHPRGAVGLAIETRGPDGKPVAADLALSVVDDTVLAFADDKQATLLARIYLEAEAPGQKIEEPNFYFGTDPKAPASLDLALGTFGWRRFDWKPLLDAPPPPPIDDPWAFNGDYSNTVKHRTVRTAGKAPVDEAEGKDDKDGKKGEEDERAPRAAKAPPAAVAKLEGAKKVPDAPPMMHAPAPPPPPAAGPVAAAPPREMMDRPVQAQALAGVALDANEEVMVLDGRQQAGGRGNKNFDLGAENQRRGRIIRDKQQMAGEAIAEDPYCCLVPERVFPVPTYPERYDGPRTDFRETLVWQSRVITDANGKASTKLYLSDAVTSFKVTAEAIGAGKLGHGEAQLQSKKPVSLAVKLPLEVSAGDHLRLPVTVANETDQPYDATVTATFGKAFSVTAGALAPKLALAPKERRSTFLELDVVGTGENPADGKVTLAVDAANLRDDVERTIKVVPVGFPQEVSIAGTLDGTKRHEIAITDVLPGSMRGTVLFYPSPLATMVKGTEAMIAEPGGCFEQASSSNYPNVMILGYLEENGAADPALVEKTQAILGRGYKLLTGYESKTKGYEWFGADPGHEALTAYGLMEFRDMAKVFGDVDKGMVDRTRAWLRSRRDGKGGFQKNTHTLHTWAGDTVTDAYITYALVEAGEKDMGDELAKQADVARTTKDPYVLALAVNILAKSKHAGATGAATRLAAMQAKDGSFPGADHTVTMSGGAALGIETTALASLGLIASGGHLEEVRKSIEWINGQRSGWGNYGSTQSTVLALKAMTAAAKELRRTDSAGAIILVVNGEKVGRYPYEKGHQGAIEVPIAKHLRRGTNTVELTLESGTPLPYSGVVSWGSKVPASSPATKVALTTQLAKSTVKLGEGVRMDVRITNATDKAVPMTLARIGLPGGLTFQTWQLQELRDKKLIDFYETRPREVIVYFRDLDAKEAKDVPLDLISTVPGTFVAPASRAYLYYTDEHKVWVAPSTVTVTP